MWYPDKISFKNLFSHKDSVYDFKPNTLTLIYGVNEDDEGCNSNASGKSVIIEAINLALTGETYRDVTKDDFINDDEDVCNVDFSLKDQNNRTLRIWREFKRSSSSKVKLFLNDSEQIEETSVANVEKRLQELLGLDKDDIFNHFIINQQDSGSFFSSNDAKQKELISRFANFTPIDSVLLKINEKIKLLSRERSNIEHEETSFNSVIEELENQIELENSKNKDSNKELINSYLEDIESFKQEKTNKEKEIENLSIDTKNKLKQIENIFVDDESIQQRTEIIREKKRERATLNEEIQEAKDIFADLNRSLKSVIKCPKCESDFCLDNKDHTPEELKEGISQIEEILSVKEESILEIKQEITSLEEEMEIFLEQKNERNRIEKNIVSNNRIVKDIQDNIIRIDKRISIAIDKIREVKAGKEDSNLGNLLKTLEDKIIQKKNVQKRLEACKEKIVKNEVLQFHFGNKGFKNYLINKVIKSIENIINIHLDKLNTNLSVKINGFKKLKDGEIREKIEIFIVRNGVKIGKFDKYSGGQKERIKLCGRIAFNKLVNLKSSDGGLDLLIFDESLDGLDAIGRYESMKILQYFNNTTLVVSHFSDEIGLEKFEKLKVRYKNGISEIVN